MRKIALSMIVAMGYMYACNCKIDGDRVRCEYYVVKKHDAKYQKYCKKYATSMEKESTPAKNAWYFLLGGDIKKAKESALKAVKLGHKFANEYLGFIYLIENDVDNAKKSFDEFKNSVKNRDYVKRDLITIKTLYDKLDISKANNMLFK